MMAFNCSVNMTCKHLKTYFKHHERMTTALFDKDIKKMAEFLAGHDSASAYFLIAGSARPSQKQHRGQSVLITWEIKI
jgi:hypothetical protein